DLISFLAVVQEHGIAILPITWQAARLPIATGATGKINEALLNLRSSFAFKCVSDKQKETENTQTIMEVLTNEVKVFGHRSIRDNPNIVDLQGVCWDVSMDKEGNNTVWPVLVFEKTPYEDLYSFLMQPVGRELCFADRLRLCTDISTAIWGLHSNDIIHGDIKPGNVLIYQGDNGFTAKVTDFGYSTRIASDEDRIVLPKTYPWNAPEHDCGSFTPDQARKMDIFSLGMLCMWTLFEKHLSNLTQLPQAAQWATRIISNLKCEGRLIMLAQQLLRAEENLTEKTMQALDEFLSRSMLDDPNER
ncbi:kinase-like protein, partial [Plenodomus tracheiphilus IPT5]